MLNEPTASSYLAEATESTCQATYDLFFLLSSPISQPIVHEATICALSRNAFASGCRNGRERARGCKPSSCRKSGRGVLLSSHWSIGGVPWALVSLTSPKSELLIPSNLDPIAGDAPRRKLWGQEKWCSPGAEPSFSQPCGILAGKPAVRIILGADHDDCARPFSRW